MTKALATLKDLRADMGTAAREIGTILNTLSDKYGVDLTLDTNEIRFNSGNRFIYAVLSAEVDLRDENGGKLLRATISTDEDSRAAEVEG